MRKMNRGEFLRGLAFGGGVLMAVKALPARADDPSTGRSCGSWNADGRF